MEILPLLFWIFLSPIAHLLLWIFGWQSPAPETKEAFLEKPRKIVIFPHSTYWDFPIMAAYALTHWPIYKSGVYTVMKPQLVDGSFGWFFQTFNCLAATQREGAEGGFITKTVERFKNSPTFTILMAPEGTTSRAEWKTGYFHLAKSLNCPIQVMGLDYYRHCIVVKNAIFPVDLKSTELFLKWQIATIPTLHPEQSVVSSPNLPTSLYSRDFLEVMFWLFGLINLSLWLSQLIPHPVITSP